jgi:hypothetical protein
MPADAVIHEAIQTDRDEFSGTPVDMRLDAGDMPLSTVFVTAPAITATGSTVPDGLNGLELFTRAEVAAALKIKATWLRDNQTRLQLPHTNLGGLVRYSRADIAAIQQLGRSAPSQTRTEAAPGAPTMTLTPLPKRVRRPQVPTAAAMRMPRDAK